MSPFSSFFDTTDPDQIAIALCIIAVVIMAIWILRLEFRIHKLLGADTVGTIEDALAKLHSGHSDFRSFEKNVQAYLESAERRLRKSIQRIETIRFNPFKGTGDGGNQSFATAFINEEGDGIIISSIYARDRMSIFTKPVSKFTSTYELTDEERHVLENVQKSFRT